MESNSFLHNGWVYLGYMLILSAITYMRVLPEFTKNRKTGLGLIGLGTLTFAMAMLPIQCGDFFYYCVNFHSKSGIQHFEDFYVSLYQWCHNYFLWRAIVWGCSVVLLLLSIKQLKVNTHFASFIFVITQFYYFGTMRNMLGFMVMFYSVILIYKVNKLYPKTIIYLILGIIGLYISQFLHRSMFLYLILLIPAVIPFGKKMIKTGLCFFPILYGLVFIMAQFFMSYFSGNEDAQITAEKYMDGQIGATFMQSLNNTIKFLAYAYLLWTIIKNEKLYQRMPSIFRYLTRYAYILIYLGALFWGQKTGGWLFLRFSDAGQLSLMFVLMYFFYHYPRTRGVKCAFAALIYIVFYNIAYITYFNQSFINKVLVLQP